MSHDPLVPNDDDAGCGDHYLRDGNDLRLIAGGRTGSQECRNPGMAYSNESLTSIAIQTSADLLPSDDDHVRDVYLWKDGSLSLLAPGSGHRVEFEGISEDGTAVLTSGTDSFAPEDTDGRLDIYRWQAGEPALITPGTRKSGRVRSLFISRNGSRAYFSSKSALVPEDQDRGCRRYACDDTYRWEDGAVELVTTGPSDPGMSSSTFDAVTDDGGLAYFGTEDGMTPDDTNGFYDVYLWADGSVQRVTPEPLDDGQISSFNVRLPQNPEAGLALTSSSPLLPADIDKSDDIYAMTPEGLELVSFTQREEPRNDVYLDYVSPEMERMVFESEGPLVSEDKNELSDLYIWEASTGGVELVSGGTDIHYGYSFFNGATPSGEKVVFSTNHQLVPQDRDIEGSDAYLTVAGSGEFELLTPNTDLENYGDIFTEAVHRDAHSVVVSARAPLTDDDTDTFRNDVYLFSRDGVPKLLSAAP